MLNDYRAEPPVPRTETGSHRSRGVAKPDIAPNAAPIGTPNIGPRSTPIPDSSQSLQRVARYPIVPSINPPPSAPRNAPITVRFALPPMPRLTSTRLTEASGSVHEYGA